MVLFILQDKKSEVQGPELIFSRSKALGSRDRSLTLTCRKSAEINLSNVCERDVKNEIQAEDNIIIIILIICGIVN